VSDPSPFDGLGLVFMGGVMVAFRRSLARKIKAARDTFDRAYNEDALVLYAGLLGGLFVLIGLIVFLVWAAA